MLVTKNSVKMLTFWKLHSLIILKIRFRGTSMCYVGPPKGIAGGVPGGQALRSLQARLGQVCQARREAS